MSSNAQASSVKRSPLHGIAAARAVSAWKLHHTRRGGSGRNRLNDAPQAQGRTGEGTTRPATYTPANLRSTVMGASSSLNAARAPPTPPSGKGVAETDRKLNSAESEQGLSMSKSKQLETVKKVRASLKFSGYSKRWLGEDASAGESKTQGDNSQNGTPTLQQSQRSIKKSSRQIRFYDSGDSDRFISPNPIYGSKLPGTGPSERKLFSAEPARPRSGGTTGVSDNANAPPSSGGTGIPTTPTSGGTRNVRRQTGTPLQKQASVAHVFKTIGQANKAAAQEYMDATHPRYVESGSGSTGTLRKRKFDWWKSHTGHFCPDITWVHCLCICQCYYCCGCANPSHRPTKEDRFKSDFIDYGSGVTSYFMFLKWGAILNLILAIWYTPQLIINMSATYHEEQSSLVDLARFSVGNLGDQSRGVKLPESFCSTPIFQYPSGCVVPKESISFIYAIFNLIGGIIVLVAWLWLRTLIDREAAAVDQDTFAASDYTVTVSNLPSYHTDFRGERLRQHFNAVLSKYLPRESEEEEGELVADINVVESEYPMLKMFRKKKKAYREVLRLMKREVELRQQRGDVWRGGSIPEFIQMRLTGGSVAGYEEGPNEPWLSRKIHCLFPSTTDKINRIQNKMKKLTDEEKKIERRIYSTVNKVNEERRGAYVNHQMAKATSQRVMEGILNYGIQKMTRHHKTPDGVAHRTSTTTGVAAFVTFQRKIAADKTRELYPGNIVAFLRQPPHLRFEEKRVRIKDAPPPDLVEWHNYRYGYLSRLSRRTVTLIVSFIILVASFVISYYASVLQDELAGSRGQICTDVYSAFSNAIEAPNKTLPLYDPKGRFDNSTMKTCFCQLINFDSTIKERGIEETKATKDAKFCRDEFCLAVLLSSRIVDTGSRMSKADCNDWFTSYIAENAILVGAALLVLLMNVVLKTVLSALSIFEKHHSATSRLRSVTWRLFVLMYINTAVVTILVYADFVRIPFVNVESNINYNDFTPDWYVFVGTGLLVTMSAYVLAAQVVPVSKAVRTWYRRKAEGAPSQDDLNERYLGPSLDWKSRYSYLINVVFVTMTYGGGMPMMFWFGFGSFFVCYWVDKYMFCNIYRTPPRHDTGLLKRMSSMIPGAIVIHAAVSAWMYTAPSVFRLSTDEDETAKSKDNFDLGSNPGISTFTERLNTSTALPLVVFMCLVVSLLLFLGAFGLTEWICSGCLNLLTCGRLKKHDEVVSQAGKFPRFNDLIPQSKLHRAEDRNDHRRIIVGVKNYNILNNPKYKDLTGVSDHFADGKTDFGDDLGWQPKRIVDAAKYGNLAYNRQ
eukprot:gb/GECG01001643.1/.p1 GENE.gb/GECG01001643.1/~~gb/GECG01001643.1/.p1  ORF type:complete len:1298 (+),score=138.22 gb/GECG01001643.1/:1-3894(+)